MKILTYWDRLKENPISQSRFAQNTQILMKYTPSRLIPDDSIMQRFIVCIEWTFKFIEGVQNITILNFDSIRETESKKSIWLKSLEDLHKSTELAPIDWIIAWNVYFSYIWGQLREFILNPFPSSILGKKLPKQIGTLVRIRCTSLEMNEILSFSTKNTISLTWCKSKIEIELHYGLRYWAKWGVFERKSK